MHRCCKNAGTLTHGWKVHAANVLSTIAVMDAGQWLMRYGTASGRRTRDVSGLQRMKNLTNNT
jgi:hypothetical protein